MRKKALLWAVCIWEWDLLPSWGILGIVLLSAQGAPSVLPLLGRGWWPQSLPSDVSAMADSTLIPWESIRCVDELLSLMTTMASPLPGDVHPPAWRCCICRTGHCVRDISPE